MSKKITTTAAQADSPAQVAELVKRGQAAMKETMDAIDAVDDGSSDAVCFAWQLIADAHDLLNDAHDDYSDVLLSAQAMLWGARDMRDSHRAIPAMLEPAIAALKRVSDMMPYVPPQSAGSTQPPAAAAIASPAADTQAGGPFSSVQEIGDELWNVRALVKSLHDSMDFNERNSERRVLRVIDERLDAIHKTM